MFREGGLVFWCSGYEFPAAAVRLSPEKRPHGPADGWVFCDAGLRVQALREGRPRGRRGSSAGDMSGYQPPVVIDSGSGMIKAGLAGTREPQFVYPNILGRAKGHNTAVDCALELCVGDQAQERRSFLSIRYQEMLQPGWVWERAESPELKPP